jgi:hypothetical protein
MQRAFLNITTDGEAALPGAAINLPAEDSGVSSL